MSVQQQRQEFVNWMIASLPGVTDYFGTDKLEAWVQGNEGSVEYQRWFDWWNIGDRIALQNSLIGRLTGMNPAYAKYMDKAKNSGDEIRGQIVIIQKLLDQTNNQITMMQNIVNTTKDQKMLNFASSLLDSYTKQKKQVSDTLALYQQELSSGIQSHTLQ